MSRFEVGNTEAAGIVIVKKNGALVNPEPDKVVTTLEEALEGVVIEWNN